MKKLFIFISFSSEEEDIVFNRMENRTPYQEFLGFWGDIEFNKEECLNAISATVNHFIDSDKEEIYFGIDEKDFDEIISRINTQNCEIIKITRDELTKISSINW